MSGYSPTWTNKGSDKLRALQTTKILMNSLKKIVSSFDISKKETEEVIVSTVADVVYNNFTPHRDLTIEEQFDLLVEVLGWKNITIEKKEENAIINLGAKVVHHVKFSDHYQYKKLDINKLILTAQNVNADMILTTEKDYVRIIDLLPNLSNIYFLTIEIRIVNCLVVLKNTLNSVLSDYTIRRHHL